MRGSSLILGAVMLLVLTVLATVSPSVGSLFSIDRFAIRKTLQSGTPPDFTMQIQPNQFLVQNGSSANPSVVFTPLNGFIGNVTLSATVSPSELSAPTVSFKSSTVRLNASLVGSVSYQISVSTTTVTKPGLYNITVSGASGNLAHSAIATVGVTAHLIPPDGVELVYKAQFMTGNIQGTPVAYTGDSIILQNAFEDLGYQGIGITGLSVNLGFEVVDYNPSIPYGCFELNGYSGPCPFLSLRPYQQGAVALTIQIPNDTVTREYYVETTVSWDICLGCVGYPAPDLVVHSYLIIYRAPSNPSPNNASSVRIDLVKVLPPVLAGVAFVVILVAVVAVWNGKRSEAKGLALLHSMESYKQSLAQRRCNVCGAEAEPSATFCGNCGHPIQ